MLRYTGFVLSLSLFATSLIASQNIIRNPSFAYDPNHAASYKASAIKIIDQSLTTDEFPGKVLIEDLYGIFDVVAIIEAHMKDIHDSRSSLHPTKRQPYIHRAGLNMQGIDRKEVVIQTLKDYDLRLKTVNRLADLPQLQSELAKEFLPLGLDATMMRRYHFDPAYLICNLVDLPQENHVLEKFLDILIKKLQAEMDVEE